MMEKEQQRRERKREQQEKRDTEEAKMLQLEQFEKDKIALKQALQDYKLFTSNSPRYREGFSPKLSMKEKSRLKRGGEESPPTSEEEFEIQEQRDEQTPALATSIVSMGTIQPV